MFEKLVQFSLIGSLLVLCLMFVVTTLPFFKRWGLLSVGCPTILILEVGIYTGFLGNSNTLFWAAPLLNCILVGILAYHFDQRWWHLLLGYGAIFVLALLLMHSIARGSGDTAGKGLAIAIFIVPNLITTFFGWTFGSFIGWAKSKGS